MRCEVQFEDASGAKIAAGAESPLLAYAGACVLLKIKGSAKWCKVFPVGLEDRP